MAKIVSGANELEGAQFDGKSIDQIRTELGPVLNIAKDAVVILNGDEDPSSNSVLRSGDELEFVKAAGEKGL